MQDVSNAEMVVSAARSKAFSCASSGGGLPSGAIGCLREALPDTVANVASAFSAVHLSLSKVIVATSVLQRKSELCADRASAEVLSLAVPALNDILACVVTASPDII